MKKLAIFFCCVFLSVAGAALAAEAPLQDKVRAAYAKLNSFEADFEQTLTHRESGSVEKRQGKLQFQKPLNIYWRTSKPHAETLIVNQNEIWDYLPDEEIAYRYSPELARESGGIIQALTGQVRLDKDFKVKAAGKSGALQKLTLLPHEPTPQMVEAALWVEPSTGLIRRAAVTDFYGNVNDVTLKAMKTDAKIAPGQFSFKPPKGVEVEDRLKKGVQERELFK